MQLAQSVSTSSSHYSQVLCVYSEDSNKDAPLRIEPQKKPWINESSQKLLESLNDELLELGEEIKDKLCSVEVKAYNTIKTWVKWQIPELNQILTEYKVPYLDYEEDGLVSLFWQTKNGMLSLNVFNKDELFYAFFHKNTEGEETSFSESFENEYRIPVQFKRYLKQLYGE